jgi:glucuronoarabinoxylan endo-1,4-beta-xylanase
MRVLSSFVVLLVLCVFSGCSGSGTSAPVSTTTTLMASPNPAIAGGTVTLTAMVAAASGSAMPTGTVTFLDGSTTLGSATLIGGAVTFSVSTLSVATHSLTASYAGVTGFSASTSTAVSLVVNPVPTTLTLTATPNPVAAGATVTLTAKIASANGVPTGSITFLDGTSTLGTATLASGMAVYTTSSLTPGTTHSLTAMYAGTTTGTPPYAASTSAPVSLVVGSAFTANASFSFSTPNQTIVGFGGSEAFYATYVDNHPNEAQILKALYDPVAGLGITFLRLQNNYNNFNGTNSTTFDPDNTKLVQATTAALGSAPTVVLSSWTPPANLKSNNSLNGCTTTDSNGNCTAGFGTLAQVNGAYNYAGFAQYWANSLKAYEAMGVTPNYISIQNEPDFPASYVACLFNPTEAPAQLYTSTQSYASYGKAFDATYQAINASGALTTVPQMIGPESFSLYNAKALLQEVPPNELAAVAHHLYNVSSYGANPSGQVNPMTTLATTYPTTLKFETEYFQTPGFYNAIDIHNALTVANDNVYLYWGLTWPSTLSNGVSTDQQGLLYIDNPFAAQSTWATPNGWTYNDAYYTMKHYSYFIRPGYVRYNATVTNADEDVSVFQSPDTKTTVMVILNTSSTVTDTLGLNLSGITYTGSSVYRSSFATPITSANAERWNNLGAYNATQGVSLPPQSAVTIVLTR